MLIYPFYTIDSQSTMDIEYKQDNDGYDIRYVEGIRHGRVPHSDICDDETEYVIRYVTSDEGTNRWEYRYLGSGYRNVDEVIPTLTKLPTLDDGQKVQILLNFGRVEEEFGMEQVGSLYGSDEYLPVYRLSPGMERTLNIIYQDEMSLPILDSEPSARGVGDSPADIAPRLFAAILNLLAKSGEIEEWHKSWNDDSDAFQQGEFYETVYAPLFVAYSIVDEEIVELVNRYHLEQGNDKEIKKSYMHCGFSNKINNIAPLVTSKEEEVIREAWKHRNDLIHGIHSRFGVQIMDIDFEALSKKLLFSIMKARTLNSYVNSAKYRIGVATPEEAVSHLKGDSNLQDAVAAAQKAIRGRTHAKSQLFGFDEEQPE